MIDPDDERFRRLLGELAGPAPDPYAHLEAVQTRLLGLQRRHTRRRTALVAAAAVVLMASGAAALVGQDNVERIQTPQNTAGTVQVPSTGNVVVSASTTTGDSSSTVAPTGSAPTGGSGTSGGEAPASEPPRASEPTTAGSTPSGSATVVDHPSTTTTAEPPTSNAVVPSTTAPNGSVPTSTTVTTAASSTTTTVGSSSHTFSNAGNSVTVRFDGTTVTLSSYQPAAGMTASVVDAGPSDRVEVRFQGSSGGDVRIRVRVKDGALVVD